MKDPRTPKLLFQLALASQGAKALRAIKLALIPQPITSGGLVIAAQPFL